MVSESLLAVEVAGRFSGGRMEEEEDEEEE